MTFSGMIMDLLSGLAVSVEIFFFTPLIAAGVFHYVFNCLVAFAMERLERRFAYYS